MEAGSERPFHKRVPSQIEREESALKAMAGFGRQTEVRADSIIMPKASQRNLRFAILNLRDFSTTFGQEESTDRGRHLGPFGFRPSTDVRFRASDRFKLYRPL
jgi:hypothetical protein